jgi:hypothetical protein
MTAQIQYTLAKARKTNRLTPSQQRQIARLERYVNARNKVTVNKKSYQYEMIVTIIRSGGRFGVSVETIKDIARVFYGRTLTSTQIYKSVFYARSKGMIRQYDSN